jgi:iron complex outermembrane receptor protein
VFPANRPRAGAPNQTTGFSADNVESEAYAFFGNLDWDLAPDWTLTLAARYDHEEKSAIDVAPPAFSATSGVVRSQTFSEWQPKIGLAWQASDTVNLYASFARGYKAGGFNAAQAFTITGGAAPNDYPAETADNYEAGFKSEWLGGALTLNGAYFHTIKQNSQLFRFIPTGFLNAVTVIDEIEADGVEIEANWRVGDGLTLRGGLGYVSAEITEYRGDPGSVGNDAPYVPDLRSSFGVNYVRPLADGLDVIFDASWDHIGEINFDARNSPQAVRDPLDLFSARVALETERWTLSIWGRNLSDERYNSDVIVVFDDPALFTQAVFKAPPRTYGAELRVRF